ncbi:hypothetical protein FA13DRAFT_307748 [Coprinellus micaceus]|uniref:Uncharacterized protein n=1 Tax=Coprinellus micaceus TaxID=71717 RepID=A0A4Y7TC73_COPMI|nr:hypothetical protein FA13DRAFT_307748 [Coprinellus micaceus]
MTAAPDEPRRIAMIGLSSTIQGSSQEASDAFKVHLDVEEAAAMVKKSGPEASEEKKALLNLLETTLRTSRRKESEKARSEMEGNFAKALRTRLDAVGQENTAIEAKGKGRASVSSGGWTAEEVFSFIRLLSSYPAMSITSQFALPSSGQGLSNSSFGLPQLGLSVPMHFLSFLPLILSHPHHRSLLFASQRYLAWAFSIGT